MDLHIAWIGGNCPVQAEGRIRDKTFYFRARYEHWRLDVMDGQHLIWTHKERYPGEPNAAGWMSEDEAREFIHKAARMFLDTHVLKTDG